MSAVKDFKCNNCGAPLPIPKNSKGHVKCPSCKTECVIEGLVKNAEMAAKENINSGYPLAASSARLHKQLLTFLSESPSLPLDIFEKGEVIREEHHCVPSYLFYCSGTASYTYEVAEIKKQTVVRDNGEKSWEETRSHTEWKNMNGTANTDAQVFASGSRTLAPQVKKLYMFFNPKNLVDYEEMEFPHDVVTHDYNVPQATAFNEHIKPYIEKLLETKVKKSLEGKETRDLSMGGSKIDKDEPVRVYLGLYNIVFKYGGKEYSLWTTGDGEEVTGEGMPEDLERQKALDEKIKAKKDALANITAPKTGLINFGKWVCIIFCVLFLIAGFTMPPYESAKIVALILGFMFTAGAIVLGVLRHKKKKEFATKKDEVEAQFQKEIDDFTAQVKDALERFKSQKKGMRGIYEAEVTGDASAF